MKPQFVYVSRFTKKEYPDFVTMRNAEPEVCNEPGSNYFCKRVDDDDGYNVVIV